MALPHSTNVFDYPPRFQFGQPGTSMCLAQTACTDTCVQMLIEYWKDRSVTLANIRVASGGPHDCVHGLNPTQTLQALRAYGIHNYKIGRGVGTSFIRSKLKNGPVLIVVGYDKYPTARAGHCGHSNDADKGGKNDCIFKGAHAVLAIAGASTPGHTGFYMRDPDHNSPSRPYKPAYDQISNKQLDATLKAALSHGWSSTYCLYSDVQKKV